MRLLLFKKSRMLGHCCCPAAARLPVAVRFEIGKELADCTEILNTVLLEVGKFPKFGKFEGLIGTKF